MQAGHQVCNQLMFHSGLGIFLCQFGQRKQNIWIILLNEKKINKQLWHDIGSNGYQFRIRIPQSGFRSNQVPKTVWHGLRVSQLDHSLHCGLLFRINWDIFIHIGYLFIYLFWLPRLGYAFAWWQWYHWYGPAFRMSTSDF